MSEAKNLDDVIAIIKKTAKALAEARNFKTCSPGAYNHPWFLISLDDPWQEMPCSIVLNIDTVGPNSQAVKIVKTPHEINQLISALHSAMSASAKELKLRQSLGEYDGLRESVRLLQEVFEKSEKQVEPSSSQ